MERVTNGIEGMHMLRCSYNGEAENQDRDSRHVDIGHAVGQYPKYQNGRCWWVWYPIRSRS